MAFLQRIKVNLLLMLCNTQTGNMFIYFISIVFVGFGKQTISHNPDVANVSVDFRTASVRCCCAIPFAEWFSSFLLCNYPFASMHIYFIVADSFFKHCRGVSPCCEGQQLMELTQNQIDVFGLLHIERSHLCCVIKCFSSQRRRR